MSNSLRRFETLTQIEIKQPEFEINYTLIFPRIGSFGQFLNFAYIDPSPADMEVLKVGFFYLLRKIDNHSLGCHSQ